MAVKIRLKRLGKKKKPVYRVIVIDSRKPRDGESLEYLGQYDATQKDVVFNVDEERVKYWLGKGAQPTDTVRRQLALKGLVKNKTFKSSQQGVAKKDRKKSASDA